MAPKWCAVCRGAADDGELTRCGGCGRRYHLECVGLDAAPAKDWRCDECGQESDLDEDEQQRKDAFMVRQKKIGEWQRQTVKAKRAALMRQEKHLTNFVTTAKMESLRREYERDRKAAKAQAARLEGGETSGEVVDEILPACDTTQPSYTTATLRDYQVDGINWMVAGYDSGIGGILGDQMGCVPPLAAPPHATHQSPPPTSLSDWVRRCRRSLSWRT